MKKLKDFGLAVSLANLTMIRVWVEMFDSVDPQWRYVLKSPPARTDYIAVLINISVLSAVYWLWIKYARQARGHLSSRVTRLGFLLPGTLALAGFLRSQSLFDTDMIYRLRSFLISVRNNPRLITLALALVALVVFTLHRIRLWILPALAAVVLILTPLALVTLGRLFWAIVSPRPNPIIAREPSVPIARTARGPTPRVLWLLFDEMDQRIAFTDREASLRLPELDALVKMSIHATNAHSPSSSTVTSIPSLFTGLAISEADPDGPNELKITLAAGNAQVGWSSLANVFSQALNDGFKTAAIGWYHPYCRVLPSSFTRCLCEEIAYQRNSMGTETLAVVFNQLRSLAETPRLSLFGQSLTVKKTIRQYNSMLKTATEWSTDPGIQLLFVHWPVPHAPYIFDRIKNDFTKANALSSGYLDGLALVDRTIGDLRRAMAARGLWENTNVIVTSDHSWRTSDRFDGKKDSRVPFIVKLAGEKRGIVYDEPFNTILLHDLILALLKEEVSTPEAAAQWLRQHQILETMGHG